MPTEMDFKVRSTEVILLDLLFSKSELFPRNQMKAYPLGNYPVMKTAEQLQSQKFSLMLLKLPLLFGKFTLF